MATVASVRGSSTITYTITDQKGNTATVVAPINPTSPAGITTTFSGGLLSDGQQFLATLIQMLSSGLVPNAQATGTSFGN